MIAWYLKNVYYAIVEVSLLGSLGAAPRRMIRAKHSALSLSLDK